MRKEAPQITNLKMLAMHHKKITKSKKTPRSLLIMSIKLYIIIYNINCPIARCTMCKATPTISGEM